MRAPAVEPYTPRMTPSRSSAITPASAPQVGTPALENKNKQTSHSHGDETSVTIMTPNLNVSHCTDAIHTRTASRERAIVGRQQESGGYHCRRGRHGDRCRALPAVHPRRRHARARAGVDELHAGQPVVPDAVHRHGLRRQCSGRWDRELHGSQLAEAVHAFEWGDGGEVRLGLVHGLQYTLVVEHGGRRCGRTRIAVRTRGRVTVHGKQATHAE